ncbi:hypothetical protein ZIOFF_013506 [Zingiber officinale]|uniref:Reverse transcriptase domain-containing protein n=1 Tax=Zingiber officinale TaxID=94328 RepID=A0A8J5HA46_ZINOF|nr:hypothetical protein ZIOFF_013506 [Zingiber officinale]
MPFGLMNAPAVFQRKMDECFKGTEQFIAVYIDDILVFSKTEEQHKKHLEKLFEICKRNGLILSPTKMKIGSSTIEFLGATIGQSRIKLQAHIITKVADFAKKELQTTKGLRSWLGLLNYARAYIPNLGRILGPLYSKTSPNGEKKMNAQDWQLIEKVQGMIKTLPDLTIPPAKCYVIIESDGCMEGWGGILKWKPMKFDSKSAEQISAYASGKFSPPKSTIDAEIYAVMNSLNSFKIYYLDKEELLIRTDCQAIISFFNKSSQNKPSSVRWIASMEPNKRRRINTSTDGRLSTTTQNPAQWSSSTLLEGPYEFLDQYQEVSGESDPRTCTPGEEDARRHLADIEWTTAKRLINSLWEFKLIIDTKETDFFKRSQHPKGIYFKDALPAVTTSKQQLLDAFLLVQGIVQDVIDTPP